MHEGKPCRDKKQAKNWQKNARQTLEQNEEKTKKEKEKLKV